MELNAGLLEELGFVVQRPVIHHCDNNSAVLTYASEVAEWRSPTLGTKYWHSRDYIDEGKIRIIHVPTKDNNADIHTKPLPNEDHSRCCSWLGLFQDEAVMNAFCVYTHGHMCELLGLYVGDADQAGECGAGG